MARLRYRMLLPDLRERPRFVGTDAADDVPTNAARLGSITHRILELWGAAAIDGVNLSVEIATERASSEFLDATIRETRDARERAERAIQVLSGFTVVAVEAPFTITVAGTLIEGAIDLIARDKNGNLTVIDYKTGRTEDEHYTLQLALYGHAAAKRFPKQEIAGAILRLTSADASMTMAPPMSFAELEASVSSAGNLDSDVPNVGTWCSACVYNGAPCNAPIGTTTV